MDGSKAVAIARNTIEEWVRHHQRHESPCPDREFDEKRGVFVTLTEDGRLRGCIGFAEPAYPLIKGLQEAAIAACSRDPRFDPLQEGDLQKIRVEVSILTKPRRLEAREPKDYLRDIKTGRDGLIVRNGFRSGLLLPQVAEEYGWDARQFLEQTCVKAGLDSDMWLSRKTEVYTFQAHVFSEPAK